MRKPFYRTAEEPVRNATVERILHELSRTLITEEGNERMAGLQALTAALVEHGVRPGSAQLSTLEWIGDRWIPLIVFILGAGTFRHSELHRTVNLFSEYTAATPISQRVLTQKLRLLEDKGLLERSVLAGVPIRTDYALTPLGRSFRQLLQHVMDWADENAAGSGAAGARSELGDGSADDTAAAGS